MVVALSTSTDGINRLAITGNNSANERKANAAGWLDASATAVRPGILPGPGVAQLTYGSPTADTWYLTAFSAILSDGAGGALEVTTGGTKSEAVTRPAASTSRYDVIALEPVYTGSPSASLVRYAGTAAASPVLSTATSQVTANGLIIGYYLVGNTGAPTITMLPKRTAPLGAVVRVYDAADLATLNPVDGDLAYQEDTDVLLARINGAWRGGVGTGILFNSISDAGTSSGSTSWANEATSALVASFVAPASGIVEVTFSAFVGGSTAVNVYHGYRISGGLTRDPADSEAVICNGTTGITGGRPFLLTGLTPGTSYTLTSAAKVTSGSVFVSNRRLTVKAA